MTSNRAGPPSALATWAALLWLVQPVSIVIEFVAAAFVAAPYSFVDNTISDLGAVSCTSIAYSSQPVPVCSPAHALLNGGFVVLGTALATGFVPLDIDLQLHALVSVPAIVLQPVALALHAAVYARHERRWWALVAIAGLIAAESVWFILRLEVRYGGLLERIAIWPVLVALPLLAIQGLRETKADAAFAKSPR